MSLTMRKYFGYYRTQKDIHDIVRTCDACQRDKVTSSKNCGKLYVTKLNHTTPWATAYTDMVGPRKAKFRLSKTKTNSNKGS